ncbi:pantoate--beta-alanine ligase [Paludibaculum fermentans]|uniref:Pantothenate synthetase n=1 Tax=Paludibaculum fermentans TaxID=1473598 RepID=A0A7S7NNW5_PALFE|nr:pantoate--beta-alanine ligase [Paludibaculum fermentans]QOY87086.1 pantoate--beta-alanine ligase [Paludibaculum fermentans]
MKTWTTVPEWQARRTELHGTLGVVPTMGALHAGHGTLVQRCRCENDVVVVSIFVNPTQFNNPRDLERYPRTVEQDLRLLESLGADEVLMPGPGELYPDGYLLRIEGGSAGEGMEGAHRPGHFQGVMTIVLKLLNLVRADRAYFGEKDYQQLQVIREMVRDCFVPTEVVPCETVRAGSGLALSSRNALLSEEGRHRAASVYRSLTTAATAEEARRILEADGFAVDYVEERWGRRFAAAMLEGVRLIDNVPVREEK